MSILKNDKIMRRCFCFSFCHSNLVKWHTGRSVTVLESKGIRGDTGMAMFCIYRVLLFPGVVSTVPTSSFLAFVVKVHKCKQQFYPQSSVDVCMPILGLGRGCTSWVSGNLSAGFNSSLLFAHNVTASSTLLDCLLLTAKQGIFMCLNMVNKYLCLKCNEFDFN